MNVPGCSCCSNDDERRCLTDARVPRGADSQPPFNTMSIRMNCMAFFHRLDEYTDAEYQLPLKKFPDSSVSSLIRTG